jgi:hypothetical protein
MPIFLKVNHQLESRMQEICQSGSEGGAKSNFVPTPIDAESPRPPMGRLKSVAVSNGAKLRAVWDVSLPLRRSGVWTFQELFRPRGKAGRLTYCCGQTGVV